MTSHSSLVNSARREALLCAVVFVAAITWTITTCVRMGYDRETELKFVLGFPDWVFWGILVPWGCCTVVAGLFSFVIMQDHDMDLAAPHETPAPSFDLASDGSNSSNGAGRDSGDDR